MFAANPFAGAYYAQGWNGSAAVVPPYISAGTALYSITLTASGEVDPGYIASTTALYTPVLIQQQAVPFISSTTVLYTPVFVGLVLVGYIASTTTVYALTIREDIALLFIAPRTIVVRPTLRFNITLIAAPVIMGTAKQGLTVECSPGVWGGPPTSITFQWRRCNAGGASCSDISGATSKTYIVQAADVGGTLRCAVTAS